MNAQFKHNRMDPTWKAAWLDALRSGRYTFGSESLRYTDPDTGDVCHCALGVLADLLPFTEFDEQDRCKYERHTHSIRLPTAAAERIGLSRAAMSAVMTVNDQFPWDAHDPEDLCELYPYKPDYKHVISYIEERL